MGDAAQAGASWAKEGAARGASGGQGQGPHKPKSGRPVWVGWVTTAGDRRQSRPEQVASDGAGQEEVCQPHSGAQAGGLPTLSSRKGGTRPQTRPRWLLSKFIPNPLTSERKR